MAGKEDINNGPDQAPGRQVINFQNWDIERAGAYPGPFARIEE